MDGILDCDRRRVRIMLDEVQEKEYAGSLSGVFDELVEINVSTGVCREIFFTEHRARLCGSSIEDFKTFAWENIHPEECRHFMGIFDREYMKQLVDKRRTVQVSFRCRDSNAGYTWLRILLVPEGRSGDILLCYIVDTGRNDGESHLLRQIVDRYVYKNCDYLLCLNVRSDSYSVFCRNEDASLFLADAAGSYSRMVRACAASYVVPEDKETAAREMDIKHVLEVLDREGEHAVTCGVMDPDRGYLRKRIQYVYYDKPNSIVFLMQNDITKEYNEQRRQKERLRNALEHARIDSLTGLCNRQAIHRAISRFLEDPSCPCAVLLFMDLDNFKNINDTLGHRSGDRVLCRVADLCRQSLRDTDLIGRIGGDEFVVFLTGASSKQEGMECAVRICENIGRITGPETGGVKLSCSIGGAICPADGRDYNTLFVKADTAVYEAKRRGKNQCVFFTPGMEVKPGLHAGY